MNTWEFPTAGCAAILKTAPPSCSAPTSWAIKTSSIPPAGLSVRPRWVLLSPWECSTKQINQLVALRMGEMHPPMLARAVATLDHITKGRLTLNIISSDLPGMKESNEDRYARSDEIIQILRQFWTQDSVEFHGHYFDFPRMTADPGKTYQQNGGPLLYFGGISPAAQELCARNCDVFLMWPETLPRITATLEGMSALAAKHDRVIDYGLRIHVIVRETESAAREAARKLVSKLDDTKGQEIKSRSQDSKSAGVLRQDELRTKADDEGYIEENIWSGIGRARSGCGSAIVGDPDQVYNKLQQYMDLGMRSFILSGYPHLQECDFLRATFCRASRPAASMKSRGVCPRRRR